MRPVQIKEFSLSTSVEYERPVAYREANLEEIAKAFCAPPLGTAVDPMGVNVNKQNDLFSYSLFIPLFNGAASVTISAQRTNVVFNRGSQKEHLDLMVDYTLRILLLAGARPSKQTQLSFTAHAVFEEPAHYEEHMRRFTSLSEAILSGGTVLVSRVPEVDGVLRYASEKSLAYEHGVFLAASATTPKEAAKDLFQLMAKRLEALASLDGISFPKT